MTEPPPAPASRTEDDPGSAAEVCLFALSGFPEIAEGDDLVQFSLEAMRRSGLEPEDGDVLALCQKIVSKSEGKIVRLEELKPSRIARAWALANDRDPREIQAVVAEARRMVRTGESVLITETHHGFVVANSGVDRSNAPPGCLVLLPQDPDASAERLRSRLAEVTGRELGVVITDTWGRPFRLGAVSVAIGIAGVPALLDYRGAKDPEGRELLSTEIALADELAGAAGLLMGKFRRIPGVLARGVPVAENAKGSGTGVSLLRDAGEDLFR